METQAHLPPQRHLLQEPEQCVLDNPGGLHLQAGRFGTRGLMPILIVNGFETGEQIYIDDLALYQLDE